jgi:membrane-associated protease RseP (regulator of RpoE activity)
MSKWRKWLFFIVLALAIPLGLSYWNHQLEKTYPERLAIAQAEHQEKYPKCPSVTTREVRNAEGVVVRTETRERMVYCDGKGPPPAEVPTWFKVVGIILLVILLCFGCFQILPFIFMAL